MRAYAYLALALLLAAGLWWGQDRLVMAIRLPVQVKLDKCMAANARMGNAVDAQNTAVEELAAAGRAQREASQKALELALKGKQDAERRARGILEARPSVPGDLCESARILSVEQIRGGKK